MQHRLVFNNLTIAGNIVTKELPDANLHPLFYVGIYSAIGLLAALLGVASQWVLFTGGLRSGEDHTSPSVAHLITISGMVLFRDLLHSLSGATFRFFDTTPTGRILNRFGKDFDTVDGMLPFMIEHVTGSVASFLGAVITVSFVVPWFLPVGALLAYCYVRLSIGYLNTGRDLRRMESTSRSPILAGFSDLVSGIVTGKHSCTSDALCSLV
jgi:ABC-type multidrug transport system fused ATPase/permease subunit